MATKTQSQSGRFGNITVNSVACNITKWEGTLRKEFADGTDSGNYDAVTGQLWTSQDPGAVGADASIEGWYDFGGSTDANFTQKFKTDGPYPMSLYLSLTTLWASWLWDFSNVKFSVSVPGSTIISFTADAKSNGAPVSLP